MDALNATVSTEEEKIRVVEIATNDANDPVVTFETEDGAIVFEAWMKDQLLTAEEIAA